MAAARGARVRWLPVLLTLTAAFAGCSSAPRQYCHENAQVELTWPKPVLPADVASSLTKAGWNATSSGSILTAEDKLPNDITLTADLFAVTNGTTLRLKADAQGYTRHPMPTEWPTLFAQSEQQLARDFGAPAQRTQSDVGHVCKTVA